MKTKSSKLIDLINEHQFFNRLSDQEKFEESYAIKSNIGYLTNKYALGYIRDIPSMIMIGASKTVFNSSVYLSNKIEVINAVEGLIKYQNLPFRVAFPPSLNYEDYSFIELSPKIVKIVAIPMYV